MDEILALVDEFWFGDSRHVYWYVRGTLPDKASYLNVKAEIVEKLVKWQNILSEHNVNHTSYSDISDCVVKLTKILEFGKINEYEN